MGLKTFWGLGLPPTSATTNYPYGTPLGLCRRPANFAPKWANCYWPIRAIKGL